MERDSIDIHYMKMAYLVSERSTCLRRHVGAVLVKDGQLLSSGYNGAPCGIEHCTEETCVRKKLNIPSGEKTELCISVHGEQNAICQAAKNGVNINGSTLYCTTFPCIACAKAMVNAGIKRIVYNEDYGDNKNDLTFKMLKNIKIEKIKNFKREN